MKRKVITQGGGREDTHDHVTACPERRRRQSLLRVELQSATDD